MIKFENYELSKKNGFQNYDKAEIGKARYVYVIDSIKDDTLEFWDYVSKLAKEKSLPIKIVGGGTNLLISGDYFDGIVIKVDYKSSDAVINDSGITVMSGVSLDNLVNQVAEYGYDMSVLAGIPGTVTNI